jgi:hypothetical protein
MKDALEDCGVNIRVRYTKNKAGVDLLADKVDHFTLYVFDSDGMFVGEYPSYGELYEDYTIPLSLKTGTYDFIVWGGNLSDDYQLPSFVKGQSTKADATLLLSRIGAGDTISSYPADLFYGSLTKIAVKPALREEQVYTVDLMKDTKTINVTARGLPITRANNFGCYIHSRNVGLRFDNLIAGSNSVKFIDPQPVISDDNSLVSKFVVMREISDKSSNSQLVFTRTENGVAEVIYNQSLIDLILALLLRTNADLDIEDEFNIEVELVYNNGSFTASVTIDGWSEEALNPHL